MDEEDQIISDTKSDLHERYIKMYKIIRKCDKRLTQMFDDFSRSKALFQLVMYYGDNLINDEELSQLSEETRNPDA